MVEIPRLQAKRSSVMPAQAGIQGGGRWKNAKPGFPPFGFAQDMLSRERRKRESRVRVDATKSLGFEPGVVEYKKNILQF